MPDSANTVDAGEHPVPANKVTKVTDRPTTASKPAQNTTAQEKTATSQPLTEKDALKQDDAITKSNGQDIAPEPKEKIETTGSGNSADEITSTSEKTTDTRQGQSSTQDAQSNPSVIVQAPTKSEPKSESTQDVPPLHKDNEGDVQMQNNEPVRQQEAVVPVARAPETTTKTSLPPPPPPPPVPEPQSIAEPVQKWLLPPIAPRFKGKKCLVLDLDETLVHSSFKVCTNNSRHRSHALTDSRFFIKQTLPSLWK